MVKRGPAALFLMLLLPPALAANSVWISGGKDDPFRAATLSGIRMVPDRDGTRALRLDQPALVPEPAADLLLGFEKTPATTDPGLAGRYRVLDFSALIDRDHPKVGSGSGRFLQPEHRLRLAPLPGSFFREHQDLGSFTIAFWYYPYALSDHQVVFSRHGPYALQNGTTASAGMRVVLRQEKAVWEIERIFRNRAGRVSSFTLAGRSRATIRRWQHIALSFDQKSGRLVRYTDGEEDEVVWATETGAYGGTPLRPAFPRTQQNWLELGGHFQGKLDEFTVRRQAETRCATAPFCEEPGIVRSRVFDMGDGHARLLGIRWEAETPAGSDVRVVYRVSPRPFAADDTTLPWQRVANGMTNLNASGGRYLQWLAALEGSENGRFSPVLRSLHVHYEANLAPHVPVALTAEPGDRSITLRWQANMDEIDGYRIYFGHGPRDYLHPGSPVTIPLSALDPRRPAYTLHGLENDRLYYISIVAWRGRGPGAQSAFSTEAYTRPRFLQARQGLSGTLPDPTRSRPAD